MSTPRQSPIKDLDERATLRARVVELERENTLLKQSQRAHTEAGSALQTSETEGTPELASLQQIYGEAPIGLCYLDTKLRYVFVNEWLAEINGLSVEEHLGRSISEVLPDVAVGVEAQLRQVLETGEPIVEGTVVAETAAQPGVKKCFEHHYDAIRSADGVIVGVTCVVQEVTARKRAVEALRESEMMTRSLLEGSPVCNKIIDLDFKLRYMSAAGVKQLKIPDIKPYYGQTYPPPFYPESMRAPLIKNLRLAMAGQVSSVEAPVHDMDGKEVWYHTTFVPALDDDGRVKYVIGASVDVTARKQVEQALRVKTDQLEVVSDAMIAFLDSGNWREASATILRSAMDQTSSQYGFIGVVVAGSTLRILAHEGIEWDDVIGRELYDQALRDYESKGYLEFTSFDNLFGKVITSGRAVVSNDPLNDPRSGGRPPGHPPLRHFLGVPILKGSEVVGMIGVANRPGGYMGTEQEKIEILCRAAGVLYDSYRRQQYEDGLKQKRKRVEEALRESEERFRVVFESAPFGMVVVDAAGTPLQYNRAFQEMLGYSDQELREKDVAEYTHPDDLEETRKLFAELRQGKRDRYQIEKRYVKKDGQIVWGNIAFTSVRDAQGDVQYLIGTVKDITERKRAEEALRESEQRYRSLTNDALDISEVGLFILDAEFRIVWLNQAIERYFGLRREDQIGRDKRQLIRERIRSIFDDPKTFSDKVLATYDNNTYTENFECHVLPDGERKDRWLEHWSKPIRSGLYAGGRIEHYYDITERKRAEEHARQLQADLAHMSRLSSMGEMATGLAHELNQPLTAITNYAQGCVRRLKSNAIGPEELANILGRIATQAQRSSSIIRGLGNLVRKSSAMRFEVDINHCIMEVADLANAEAAHHHAKARFELEPNLPLVMADQTQLQQVILNLVQNGCEAIEDAPKAKRAVTVRTKRRGDRELEILVSDNGRGISEPLGERLFEAFFTTKAQGIGMGLAISRSIVESHGGRLWATPNRGKGTTFHFTLPIVGGHSGDE